jgi:DNA-binding SARP family transcriptional activator
MTGQRSRTRIAAESPRSERDSPQLRLLGGFTLLLGGEEVLLPSNAQRVLAGLAVVGRPRVSQTRSALAERIWAVSAPDRAQGNLRTALWRIRQADPRLVTTLADQVRLGTPVTVDVHDCLAQAQRLLSDGEPLETGDDSLDPLMFDLLPGWDDDWLLLERERVRQIRLHALEALSARLLANGRHGMAVQAALAATAGEPLRESAHHALIAAQLGEGNTAEAHRYFGQFRHLLWRELRLSPSVSFQELLERYRPRPML